ncbi:hypothetical protein IJI00_00555 [Candidatus Saccharibacteria bacterium]|nr:hypothetical protein [Candidatus Saccharibacteria bacterium]
MISKATRINSIIILAVTLLSSIIVKSGSSKVSAAGTDFKISVQDEITVNIDEPVNVENSYGAIIKKVGISVSSNSDGYTATMSTATNENRLIEVNNSSLYFNMLGNEFSITSASMDNMWGWNVVNKGAAIPVTYDGMATAEEEIGSYVLAGTQATTTEKDIYFAAKPTATTSAGTYTNSVVISVVAGYTPPEDAASTPTNTANTSSVARVSRTLNVASDTGDDEESTSSKSSVSVNTTNNSQYDSYDDPLGETSTSINEGTPLATGLAVTAGVAATTGIILFAIAKRKEDDDEDY